MINILFVDDNYSYSKNIINKVMEQNPDVRLFKFHTDGNEALKVIVDDSEKIDIILLDLKLPGCSGIDILKIIEEKSIQKYSKSIIVISGEPEMLKLIQNNQFVYTFIPKGYGFEYILEKINTLIELKKLRKEPIENRIMFELRKVNYNFSYIGTKYLYESILIICTMFDHEKIKLEKKIYPLIAQRYHTTVSNVKTNIVNSTNEMYYDCRKDVLNHYFGLCDSEKPTPKEVISVIVAKIEHQMEF